MPIIDGKLVVRFIAQISPLQSAIQIAGDDGIRIKLDIYDNDISIDELRALKMKELEVFVREIESSSKKQKPKSDDNYVPQVGLSKGDELK